jgi:hypothetical protein
MKTIFVRDRADGCKQNEHKCNSFFFLKYSFFIPQNVNESLWIFILTNVKPKKPGSFCFCSMAKCFTQADGCKQNGRKNSLKLSVFHTTNSLRIFVKGSSQTLILTNVENKKQASFVFFVRRQNVLLKQMVASRTSAKVSWNRATYFDATNCLWIFVKGSNKTLILTNFPLMYLLGTKV